MEFIKPNSRYKFVSKTRFFGACSVVVVALSLVVLLVRGLNFGTDFQGGTEMVFKFEERPSLEDLRAAVGELPYEGASLQTFGSEEQIMIRVRQVSSLSDELVASMEKSTQDRYGDRLQKFEVNRAGGLITVLVTEETGQEKTSDGKASDTLAPGQVQKVIVNPDGTRTFEGYVDVDPSKGPGRVNLGIPENTAPNGNIQVVPVNPGQVPPQDRLVFGQMPKKMPKPRSPEDRALIEKTLGPNDPGLPDKPFDAGPALPPPKYDPAKRPQEVRTDAGWVGTFHSPTPADAEMTDEDRKKALSWEGLKAKTKRQLEAPGPTEGDQRSALTAHFRNLGVTVVGEAQRFPTDGLAEYRIGFAGVAAEVGEALAAKFPEAGVEPNAIYYVGPQVGEQLRNEGVLSVIYALLGILIYIVFRFNFTFAPGAIIALVHDVLITVGIFSLFQLKFDLPIIAALLTIVGYSLNDTIVVYDRIREELGKVGEGKEPLETTVDRALNSCISRTILTSVTTLIVVVILWAFGGPTIREFSIAMTIGVVVGTYSSMFVASPIYLFLVHWWEQRQEALELENA
ncbi:MAG: protein translocase subunit SecF [Myxococcota bacterium]|nr:protein translocase subunit SecF [Myxococcota bacterium]